MLRGDSASGVWASGVFSVRRITHRRRAREIPMFPIGTAFSSWYSVCSHRALCPESPEFERHYDPTAWRMPWLLHQSFAARKAATWLSIDHDHVMCGNASSANYSLGQVNLIDEFDILQIVGEGWFGKILLTEHRSTQTEMVLKALPKAYTGISDFFREFHYGLHLSAHRNIITTYDVAFETAGFYVFSQEYAPLGEIFLRRAHVRALTFYAPYKSDVLVNSFPNSNFRCATYFLIRIEHFK